jgi:endonuclease YncB( thermonuclease family)
MEQDGKGWRLLALCLLTASAPCFADTLIARVVGVSDGDTITVLDTKRTQHKIRLAAIDAPEKGQPFGSRSKKNLSRLVYGKDARIDWQKKDRYGRIIGTVWVVSPDMPCAGKLNCRKTLDAGMAQLAAGLAWHYKKHASEQEPQQRGQYEFAEEEARARRVGLWRDDDPVPPWEWRRQSR